MKYLVIFLLTVSTGLSYCQREECSNEFYKSFYQCITADLGTQDIFLEDHTIYIEASLINASYEITSILGESPEELIIILKKALDCLGKSDTALSQVKFIFYHVYKDHLKPRVMGYEYHLKTIKEFKSEYRIDEDICYLYFFRSASIR